MADIKKKGSKQEVYEGKALCTSGGLKKEDLCCNAKGQIVSKKRSEQGKKQYENIKNFREKKSAEKAGGSLPAENIEKEKEPLILPEPQNVPQPQVIQEEKKEEKIEELPKAKGRRYSSKKIKNENPVIEEIQYGDKF